MVSPPGRFLDLFSGWTREILYDDMRQVRLGPDRLNPLFADFVRHCGMSVKTHAI